MNGLTPEQISTIVFGVLLVAGIAGLITFAAWPLPLNDDDDENHGDC